MESRLISGDLGDPVRDTDTSSLCVLILLKRLGKDRSPVPPRTAETEFRKEKKKIINPATSGPGPHRPK